MYKARMKKAHDQNILRRSFEPGQKVLYNSRLHLFPGKLRSRWTGLFIVRSVFSYGAIEIEDPKNGSTFKVNGQRLKPFLELQSSEVETTLLEDPSYSEWLSSGWKVWLKTENLALVGGNPHHFFLSFDFLSLVVIFRTVSAVQVWGSASLTVCPTCITLRYCISSHIGDNVFF
jgi:hypothetical protein